MPSSTRDQIIKRDAAHVWHPFTQAATADAPIPIVRGQGASLFDVDGREYLDLISSWWVNAHGHSHPRLTAALARQAETLEHTIFAGFTHPPATELAHALAQQLPGELQRVFFSDDGSTAVEVALKLAFQYWRNLGAPRQRFLALRHGYHGDTFGAMAAGRASGFFTPFESLLVDVDFIELSARWEGRDDLQQAEQQTLAELDRHLQQHGEDTAALILEPLVQGAGGMRMYSLSLLDAVMALARRHGILVIFDEVMTGFGRTGHLFVSQAVARPPDLVCLSKILTGGYMPLAVTVATETIYQAFLAEDFDKAFAHGHSYTANPLGCALALENLRIFAEEPVTNRIGDIADWHRQYFLPLGGLPGVERVRLCGTIAALDMSGDDAYGSQRSKAAMRYFIARGWIIRPLGSTIYLMPPYCISEAQLRGACAVIADFIRGEA